MILAGKGRPIISERGFTLLEMLVAVTLVAMMAVGLWAVFRVSIRSWSHGTQSIDTSQRNRSILDLVRKQIASTYGVIAPIDPLTGGMTYPIFSGTESSLRFISLNSLRFQENPGLTMVSYDTAPDRQGNYYLFERESRYLGPDSASEGFVDRNAEKATAIFQDLSSFTFEYFDPGDSEKPARWVREWDGQTTGRLPLAVSLTMVARDSNGGTLSRHMVIPILAKPNDPRLNPANPMGQGNVRGVGQ